MGHKNSYRAERNRAIFDAHESGERIERIAEDYPLAIHTVRSIICHERHKNAVCLEEFYRVRRKVHWEATMLGRATA